MEPFARLREENRTSRRTIADALEVVRQEFGLDDVGPAHIRISSLSLLSGQCLALVDAVFPDFGCSVSLPTSSRFRGRKETNARTEEFKISRLDRAEVRPDGSVLLADGTSLHAVEVRPALLPYEPSKLEEQILRHVIVLTNADYCFRSLRERFPEELREMVPEIRLLDYSRLSTIDAPPLKVIQAYINDNDPGLLVSNQKIADALAMYGIRIPRRRPRAIGTATI